MSLELEFVELERAVVHYVYKPIIQPDKSKIQPPPVLTEKITTFDDIKSKELIREKIIQYIKGKKAVSVKSKENPIKKIMLNIKKLQTIKYKSVEYEKLFLDLSKDMAIHYMNTIDGRNNDCLVMLLEINDRKKIRHAILIFELQIGVKASLDITNKKIDINYIEGLILSRNTRLFKIVYCLFEDDFDAIVCDTLSTKEQIVANFFINDFIECEFIEIPSILTREFYLETLRFINSFSNNELKYIASVHFYSYLYSEDSIIIGIEDFADKLKPENRRDYLKYMEEKNIATRAFQKDTSRIETYLKKEKIEFDDEISLIAPPEKIKEKVKIERVSKDDEKNVSVSFQSKIKRIS